MTTDDTLIKLADVVLRFGAVPRLTEDGAGRPEYDATHTVMLQMVCRSMIGGCRFPKLNDRLDWRVDGCACGSLDWDLVNTMSLVHDLAEFKHGDTPTLRISAEGREAKEALEVDALRDLEELFAGSWICPTLRAYHAQLIPEARFVRAMDKNVPKLTHLNNGCVVLRRLKVTRAEFCRRILVEQSSEISQYAGEFLCVMDMHRRLAERIAAELPESYDE